MTQLFFNNARGVLAESVSTGSTLIKIKDHANIPASLAIGDYFLLTLFRDTTRYGENIEVVKVTAITAGTNGQLNLTVEREYEFPAQIHTAGTRLEARLTAQSLRDLLSEAKSFTQAEVAALLDAAPGALDTLNELAAALGDDPNFAATMTTELGKKLDKTSYTAADVLAKLLTVDGNGSGLDADTLDGKQLATIEQEYTAADQAHVDALNPHPQYAQVADDLATIDWNFATGKYARDNGERVETTNLGELATVTRPDTKQVFGPNGFQRTAIAGAVARQWNPVTGEAEGVVQEKASKNLLKFSQEFVGWSEAAKGMITPTKTWAPDGTYTGILVSKPAESYRFISNRDTDGLLGCTCCASIFVKKNTLDKLSILLSSDGGSTIDGRVVFDLNTETGLDANSLALKGNGIEAVRGGWYRVWVAATFSSGMTTRAYFYAGSYSDATEGDIFFWGAQLEKGDKPTSYIPTPATFESRASTGTYFDSNGVLQTAAIDVARENHVLVDGEWVSQGLLIEPKAATNKLLWSEAFDNAAWVPSSNTVLSPNAIVAPDGKMTAFGFSVGSGTFPQIVQTKVDTSSDSQSLSFFLKANGVNYAQVRLRDYTDISNYVRCIVDLTTGEITRAEKFGEGVLVSAKAEKFNDGWWRVSVSGYARQSATSLQPVVVLTKNSAGDVATGSNSASTDGIYIWGAQLEEGTQPTSYIPTADTPVTRAADVVSSVEVERGQDDLTAPLTGEYNPRQGTWVIDAEHNDVAPLTGIGLDGAYTSGRGKLVYSYDENGGEAFANGAKVFDTPPVKKAQTVGLGHQTTDRVQYFPKKLPVAQAIARATGSVAVDYPFADGRSMSFDFVNQDYGTRSLTNALAVKRSSNLVDLFPEYSRLSPATYWDANGVLCTAGINEPRINHNPVTGEVLGVLLEGNAENKLRYSEQFDNSAWGKTNAVVTSNTHESPDSLVTTDTIECTLSGNWNGRVAQNYTATVAGWYTSSVYAKAGTTAWAHCTLEVPSLGIGRRVWFDLANGVVGSVNPVSTSIAEYKAGIEDVGGGFYRCWISVNISDVSEPLSTFWMAVDTNNTSHSSVGNTFHLWGPQLEQGSRPSSYIKTEDAPVTRAADDLGRALGEEYNQYTGTMILEATANGPNEFWTGYASLSADGDNYIGLLAPAQTITARGQIFVDRSAGTSVSSPTMVNGQVFKAALSYSSDGGAVSYDGSTASFVSGPNNTLPNASHLTLGSYDPSGVSLGATHIRSLTYYPEAKSDSFLQEITA